MKVAMIAQLALAGLLMAGGAPKADGASPTASLIAIDAIEPGLWQLRELGSTAAPRPMCVIDPATLLQIEHGQARCTHLVLNDSARSGTISYTCPGTGNGRTTLRLESSREFRLETQGIMGGAPFDKVYQAHRMGACTGGTR